MKVECVENTKDGIRKVPMYSFHADDVFRIPFTTVRFCCDDGENNGPWITFDLGDGIEIVVNFEAKDFDPSDGYDPDGRLFLKALGNIVYKYQVPITIDFDSASAELPGLSVVA